MASPAEIIETSKLLCEQQSELSYSFGLRSYPPDPYFVGVTETSFNVLENGQIWEGQTTTAMTEWLEKIAEYDGEEPDHMLIQGVHAVILADQIRDTDEELRQLGFKQRGED